MDSLRIRIEGDHLIFECKICNALTVNKYLGFFPTTPQFEFMCPVCEQTVTKKLQNTQWKYLPQEPDKD